MIAPALFDGPETVLADRRRPGRPEHVSQALLPLLRAEERALLPPLNDDDLVADRRVLGAGQGVVLGMVIGGGLWAMILAGIYTAAQLF